MTFEHYVFSLRKMGQFRHLIFLPAQKKETVGSGGQCFLPCILSSSFFSAFKDRLNTDVNSSLTLAKTNLNGILVFTTSYFTF